MTFVPHTPVFVSSTYSDLVPYRNAVRQVLSRYYIDIHGMELFGAQTRKPLETCLAEVLTSEIFIGIIGMRYGSMDEATGKSFVEREYEAAKKSGLEIWIFLIDEEKTNIPPIYVDCPNAEKLKEFKKQLKQDHTCSFYSSVDDLALRINANLEKFFNEKQSLSTQSKAFVSATVSAATIAKGDDFFIAGTATETTYPGVAIWFFGPNYYTYWIAEVRDDSSYITGIPSSMTVAMPVGQYFVIIQHSMGNHSFDVMPVLSIDSIIVKNSSNKEEFIVRGKGSVFGFEAATNLIEFLNKSGIDDTYTKLSFLIEEPVIRIDPISPKKTGEKFTISGQTNLAAGNDVVIEVMPKVISPGTNSYFAVRGATKIVRGDSGLNAFNFDVELKDAEPGEYVVNVICYKIGIVASQSFIVT